jgi:hypothetical protein
MAGAVVCSRDCSGVGAELEREEEAKDLSLRASYGQTAPHPKINFVEPTRDVRDRAVFSPTCLPKDIDANHQKKAFRSTSPYRNLAPDRVQSHRGT